jgi:hypothetical protein
MVLAVRLSARRSDRLGVGSDGPCGTGIPLRLEVTVAFGSVCVMRTLQPGSPTPAGTAPLPGHVRVAIIGAGFAGIGAGIRLQQAGRTDFVILEHRMSGPSGDLRMTFRGRERGRGGAQRDVQCRPAAARVHQVDPHRGQVLRAGSEHRDPGSGGPQHLSLAQH